MIFWQHLPQAVLAYIILLAGLTGSYALIPLLINDNTPALQSQVPFEGPGCDGSGLVDPDGRCNGNGIIDNPPDPDREGFKFDNPSTDCEFVTQMYIYDTFKVLEKDMNKLFTIIHKDVDFTVVGHHPIAGRYHDLLHFYVNALRRVAVLFSDHQEKFEVHPQAIHGGCNSRWSVQEVLFKGKMNSGDDFEVINVWVTRWHQKQMVEIRTYIDAGRITDALHKNELWWNGTWHRDNWQYMPGPAGMPDLKALEGLLGYPDGRKYED